MPSPRHGASSKPQRHQCGFACAGRRDKHGQALVLQVHFQAPEWLPLPADRAPIFLQIHRHAVSSDGHECGRLRHVGICRIMGDQHDGQHPFAGVG